MGEMCADIPKCMLPVGGRPFLHWILSWLARHSVPARVAVRQHGEVIQGELAAPLWSGRDFDVVWDRGGEGTGTALIGAAEQLRSERLLLLNGDTLFTCDLPGLLGFHRGHGGGATQVLTRGSQQNQGAILLSDHSRRVLATDEGRAPVPYDDPPGTSRWSSTGWYLLDRDLVLDPEFGTCASLELDLVPALIERGVLYGHTVPRPMYDFGTPARYKQVMDDRNLLLRTYGRPLRP